MSLPVVIITGIMAFLQLVVVFVIWRRQVSEERSWSVDATNSQQVTIDLRDSGGVQESEGSGRDRVEPRRGSQ